METVTSKIPDVWYDLYVRLIPGSLFISAMLFVFGVFPKSDSIASALWILIAGYMLGSLLQPVSAFAARRIEVLSGQSQERKRVRPAFPADHREVLVLSKQHAETVGMVACALFTALLAIIQRFGLPVSRHGSQSTKLEVVNNFNQPFLLVCFVVFVVMAYERAFAARQRAIQLQQHSEFKQYLAKEAIQQASGGL